MKFISLGSSCSIAHNLKILNKRDESFPFDWIRSSRFSSINQMLTDNFKELFNIDKYQLIRSSDKFFLQKDNYQEEYIEMNIFKNSFYQINFYHEFPKNIDFKQAFNDYKIKYQRRINRLIKLIADPPNDDHEIIFIRDQIKFNHIKLEDINDFVSIIKNLNPNLKFKLIIILNNPKNKDISKLMNNFLDNIIIINSNNEFKTWQREDIIQPILKKFIQ